MTTDSYVPLPNFTNCQLKASFISFICLPTVSLPCAWVTSKQTHEIVFSFINVLACISKREGLFF